MDKVAKSMMTGPGINTFFFKENFEVLEREKIQKKMYLKYGG